MEFTRLILHKKTDTTKKLYRLDISNNSYGIDCLVKKTCPVNDQTKEDLNTCVCPQSDHTCIAMRLKPDNSIENNLIELQNIGFFDPSDFAEEMMLKNMITQTR